MRVRVALNGRTKDHSDPISSSIGEKPLKPIHMKQRIHNNKWESITDAYSQPFQEGVAQYVRSSAEYAA